MLRKMFSVLISFALLILYSSSLFSQTFLTHNTGRLQATVFNNGYVGHVWDGTQGQGVRFLTNLDAMFTAGIMFGTASSGIRGMVGSFVSNNVPIVADMINVTTYTGFSSNAFFNEIATCVYQENQVVPNRLGLVITQTSYSNTNDDFVFVAYSISNPTSTGVFGLYVGMFADWDVGLNNYLLNRGGLDAGRNMLYQWEASTTPADPNYYGVVALSGLAGGTTTWLFPGSGGTIRDTLFKWISSISEPQAVVEDHRMFIGSGPFNINPGGTLLVGFALCAGNNLANLQTAADQAQIIWDNIIVPVELTSFSASITVDGFVKLEWTTATELNNRIFEIERRQADGQYSVVGFVQGAGTSSEEQSYVFIDKSVSPGTYFYRLKQIDFDGRYEYSNEIEVEVIGPLSYSLSQNFPNPFNPSTTISYQLPEDDFVSLKVYNSLGQEVAELVNGVISAGTHSVDFDAASLSSGIYYYTLRVGDNKFVKVNKMTLMK